MVVLVVIDDFPEWSFDIKHEAFTHGFARLLSEGQWRVGKTASLIPRPLAAPSFELTDAELAPSLPWTPADAGLLAKLSGTDDAQRGEVGILGLGPTFPHAPANPAAVRATPLANRATFDHALRLIERDKPARLVITFPAHAAMARGWGHESWEAWDMELSLDRGLEALLDSLDRNVGRDRWAMIVTSDHGGSRLPERGGGGRITVEQLQRAANAAASLNLGTGDWIAPVTPPYVHFTPAALAQSKKELANAYRKVIFALRAFPGLAIADRTDAYASHCELRSGDSRAICLAIDPAQAGELVFFPARGWILDSEAQPRATSYGSLTDDDRTVPVFLLPFGRTPHSPQVAPGPEMSLSEIEPLLSAWQTR